MKIEPPRYSVVEDVYYTYACKQCEAETDEALIVKTPKEPAVLPGSFASPEAIAHIMGSACPTHCNSNSVRSVVFFL